MKRITIKKKMLYSLLIPYIALGIVATIVFGYMYKSSIQTIHKEVIGNSYGKLNEITKEVDYLLEDIQKLVIEIEWSTRFTKMLTIKAKNRTQIENYNIAMGIQELRQIKKYNGLIKNLTLYYHKGDFAINVESIRTLEGLYKDFDFEKDVSYEEWEKLIKATYDREKIVNIGGQIFYIFTTPVNENLEKLNIIVQIEEEKFKELLNGSTSFNEGSVYIVDEDYKGILSNQEAGALDQDICSRIEKGKKYSTKSGVEYETIKVDGKKYTMIQTEADKLNVHYIWMIENKELANKSDYIRQSFVGVVIAFGVILSIGIYGVGVNYRQIRLIMERLNKNNFKFKGNQTSTEVSFINSALNNMEQKIEDQNDMVVENILRKVLYGLIEKEDEGYRALISRNKGDLEKEHVVAIFEPVIQEDKDAKELKLNMFVLENVMREVFNEEVFLKILAIQNWEVIILTHNMVAEEGSIDYILDGLERTRMFLSTQLGLSYTIGVSSPVGAIEKLASAYKEAIEALREKVVIGNNKIIYYGNLQEHRNQYHYDQVIHNQILNHMKIGDEQKVIDIIDELFDVNFREYQISPEQAKLLILDILSTISQLAKEVDYMMQAEAVGVLKEIYTIQEMQARIYTNIKKICQHYAKDRACVGDKKTKIIKYIEDNYQDISLNVGMVADYLELNPSYLSRFFKEQTGENLLTYINRYRIEKVKGLLRTTDKTLKVIASETGFIDSAALSRAFKKYEAITPSQYKNICGS